MSDVKIEVQGLSIATGTGVFNLQCLCTTRVLHLHISSASRDNLFSFKPPVKLQLFSRMFRFQLGFDRVVHAPLCADAQRCASADIVVKNSPHFWPLLEPVFDSILPQFGPFFLHLWHADTCIKMLTFALMRMGPHMSIIRLNRMDPQPHGHPYFELRLYLSTIWKRNTLPCSFLFHHRPPNFQLLHQDFHSTNIHFFGPTKFPALSI